jgi:Tfp pilus assembly protein FimT
LIELILVMGVLVAVISTAAASLSRFYRGRILQHEAGRFIALTRYAQNRAVSSGVPMLLWIDYEQKTYGLREEARFNSSQVKLLTTQNEIYETPVNAFHEEKTLNFKLAENLQFLLDNRERLTNGLAMIRFYPDGAIDEDSLQYLVLEDKNQEMIPISQSHNRLYYEISDPTNEWLQSFR